MGVGAARDRLRWRKIANLRPLRTTKPPNREGGNTPCYTFMRLTRRPPIRENKRKLAGRPAIGDSGDRRYRRPPVSESRPDLTPLTLDRQPGGVKRPREMRGRALGRLAPVRWADSPALRLCARRHRRPDLVGRRAYRRVARQSVGEYMAARVPTPRHPYPRAKGGAFLVRRKSNQGALLDWRSEGDAVSRAPGFQPAGPVLGRHSVKLRRLCPFRGALFHVPVVNFAYLHAGHTARAAGSRRESLVPIVKIGPFFQRQSALSRLGTS